MAKNSVPRLLGTSAAARILNLSDNSVTRLADEGKLPSMRDSSGKRLFDPADVMALARKRQKLPYSRRNAI